MPGTQIVDDVMTRTPRALAASTSVREAAREMKNRCIGAIVVESEGQIRGIVTDRDIVVRCIAVGSNPDDTNLGSICSPELVTLSPRDGLDTAVQLMREKAIRRIPVVEDGRAVGIISLGDLAQARDNKSALSEISAAAPNG